MGVGYFDDSGLLTEDDFDLENPLGEHEDEEEDDFVPLKIGFVVSDPKVTVRRTPELTSSVIGMLDNGTEVVVSEEESNYCFYKIYTAVGIEGYCMKAFIKILE